MKATQRDKNLEFAKSFVHPAQFENVMTVSFAAWLCAHDYQGSILYDTWATVSRDLIDTMLGKRSKLTGPLGISADPSLGHCSLISLLVISNWWSEWVQICMAHWLPWTHPTTYPLRSWWKLRSVGWVGWGGRLFGRDNCLSGGQERRLRCGLFLFCWKYK